MDKRTQSARGDRQNAWKIYFKFILNIFLIFVILTCLLVIIFQFLNSDSDSSDLPYQNNQEFEGLSRSLPPPSPKPIPHGPKAFTVSRGLQNAPQFSEGQIIPYDPEQDSTQKIQIKITSQTPVKRATTTMITDNQEKTINMKLIEGIESNGTWLAE